AGVDSLSPAGGAATPDPLDEPRVDQQPVESPCFGAAGAQIEQAAAAAENLLLLDESRIERHPPPLAAPPAAGRAHRAYRARTTDRRAENARPRSRNTWGSTGDRGAGCAPPLPTVRASGPKNAWQTAAGGRQSARSAPARQEVPAQGAL